MAIDPILRQALESKGMFDKIKELEKAERKGGFFNIVKETARQMFSPTSETQQKVIKPVAEFIAPIGKSVGTTLAAPKIKKQQAEVLSRGVELQQNILKQLRDPNITKQQKEKLLTISFQNDPEIISKVPELQKTTKQVLGEGALTFLNTATLLSGVSGLRATGQISSKLVGAKQAISTFGKGKEATKTAKIAGDIFRTLRTGTEGAAFGAAIALEEGKKGFKDVAKEAGLFAGISMFAPPILGKGFKLLQKNTGKLASLVNKAAEQTIPKLKAIADKVPAKTGNFLIDTASSNRTSLKRSLAEFGARVFEKGTKPLEPALIDRLHNIKVFDSVAETILGTRISMTPNSAYIKARNFAGIEGKFTVAANDFNNIIKKDFKDVDKELLGYLKGLDLLNRANRGQAIEAGLSTKQIQAQLLDIEKRIADKGVGLERLQEGISSYNKFVQDKILFGEFVDSGLESAKAAEKMVKENPNWVPHDVLDFFENKATEGFTRGGSFNVVDNAIKVAKGSERELAAIDIATLHRLQQVQSLAERNRVMRSVFEKVEKDPEAFGMTQLRSAEEFGETKIIDPLIKEAKKYKTADEFVNNKISNVEYLKTNSTQENFNLAKESFNNGDGVIPINNLVEEMDDVLWKPTPIRSIKEFDNLSSQNEFLTVDKNKLSQLTDIWKRAKSTPPTGLTDIQKEGFEKVSYFKDGIKEDWLIPSDLATALKNLDAPQTGLITKWLKIPADILRAGATRLNIAFTISNFPRDLQTAAGISKEGFSKKQLADAINDVSNLNNPQTRAFFEGGGAFGGLIGAEKPSRDILAASRRAPVFNAPIKLAEIIEKTGERFENATRFAVYKGAIAKGLPEELAIFEARNATVDFARQGNVIGMLNKVVPFLNARTQGLVNIGSSLKNDPTKFVRRQLFQSVYPAMFLYAHNNQYDAFKNIPQRDRDNNWIIMYGETDGIDDTGAPIKIPEYVKIKKGEVQQIAANTIEQYFDMSDRENPRDTKKFLQDQVLGTSPISSSSLGPLTTPFELQANYDLFRKTPIEPEFQELVPGGKKFPRDDVPAELRQQRWNGATAKQLSSMGLDKLGLSPARIEFTVGKIFGTAGSDLLKTIDMTQTGLDQTGIPDDQATTEQILSRTPIFRTFIGSNSAGEKIALYEIVEKISKQQFDEIEMPREIEAMSILEIGEQIYKTQGKEEANKYINELDLSKDMKDRIKRIKENKEIGQTNQKQIYDRLTGNSVKIRYIIENLNLIESKAQKNAFIKDMEISEDIRKKLFQAKDRGLLNAPTTD